MGAPKTNQEIQEEFLELLEYMRRTKAYREAKQRTSPLDPFALLERLIRGALSLLERAVTRLIYALKR